MRQGWIKLHRELQEKAIWKCSTAEQKVVLITILMLANHQENEWEFAGERFICKPGQFVTSLNSLAEACGKGISVQNVRTALNRFEKYGFLTNASTKTGRLITVENWGKYQGFKDEGNILPNKDIAEQAQTITKEPASIKNCNNGKECKTMEKELYTAIVDYLNRKTGANYRATGTKTQSLIHARLAEGFTFDDFVAVIDKKCSEWLGTEWEKFLRPETLFGTKFESYLNAKVTKKQINTGMAVDVEDPLDDLPFF